jgi:subtilisin family serine protease
MQMIQIGAGQALQVDADGFVLNRFIIEFSPVMTAHGRQAALHSVGARFDHEIKGHSASGLTAVITSDGALGDAHVMERLLRLPGVISVERDQVVSATVTSNDPSFTGGQMWGMTGNLSVPANLYGSQAAEVWGRDAVGSMKTVVGVIDSGVDYRHPDLYRNIWLNQKEIPLSFRSLLTDTDGDTVISFRDLNALANAAFVTDRNSNGYIDAGDLLNDTRWEDGADTDANGFVDDLVGWDFTNNDNDPLDDYGHGTHVAGTVGAQGGNGIGVAGVAWNVQIVPLKFLSSSGSGTTSGAIAAIDYYTGLATANAASLNFVGTNNSWGGGSFSSALQTSIINTGRQDQLFIASAGNNARNNDISPAYPASYSTRSVLGFEAVISVASITSTGALSSFSNYGLTSVDIGAPGSSIYSTTLGGGYGYLSGTSMASPHVTGTAALIAAAFPGMSASQIGSAIINNTLFTTSLSGRTLSAGRLDIGRIFDALGFVSQPAFAVQSMALSDTVLAIGETLTLTLTFSQAVSGLDLADFVFDSAAGGLSALTQNPSNALQWTVRFTPAANVTDPSNTIGLTAGSYTNTTGTLGPAATSSNFAIDTAAPAVSGFALPGNALIGGQQVTLSFSFSEQVSGLTLSDFTWDTNIGTLTTLVQGASNQWTAKFTPLPDANTASSTITLNAGSYTDTAGNAGPGAVTAAFSVTAPPDSTAPTIISMLVGPSPVISGQTATLTITFSEAVAGLQLADLAYDLAAGSFSSLAQNPSDAKQWTALFTPAVNITDPVNTVSITAGSYTDLAGNPGGGGTSGNYAVDTQAPAVQTMTLSASSLTTVAPVTLSVVFTEAVAGLALSDFTYNTALGTLSNLARVGTTNEWRATFTPRPGVAASGELITLSDLSYTDTAGNAGSGEDTAPYSVNTPSMPPIIAGTSAAETVLGTAGNDTIIGVPVTGTALGQGTIDRLTGNGGNDRFILGDARGIFYNDGVANTSGGSDYALITDFRSGDKVLLSNTQQYVLVLTSISGQVSTIIAADLNRNGSYSSTDEIIGVLQGAILNASNLTSEVFEGYNYIVMA